jgi:hypothetical protein
MYIRMDAGELQSLVFTLLFQAEKQNKWLRSWGNRTALINVSQTSELFVEWICGEIMKQSEESASRDDAFACCNIINPLKHKVRLNNI